MYEKNIIRKFINLTRIPRYVIADKKFYNIFRNYFVVSQEDQNYILKKYPDKKVFVVPNSIELGTNNHSSNTISDNEIEAKHLPPHTIIFTGDMSFFQNVDAVKYFVKEIYPIIKLEISDIKFYVVGKSPSEDILKLAASDSSIIVTGYVENMKTYLNSADVYVAPIRSGAGTRTKILEAMSCKKPIVTTSIGTEGILTTHNKDLVVADNPEKFAKYVIELMKDEKRRKSIGENAYALIEEKYLWTKTTDKIKNYYKEVVSK